MNKEKIESAAWSYIAIVAGSDPNVDPSQFEPDYNGFMAGADFVINSDSPVSEIIRSVIYAIDLKEIGRHTQAEQEALKAIRMINNLA
jgi:hypothetical protein